MTDFITNNVSLLLGDCVERMRDLPDNSVDSVVTDPPYHLTSIVKRFGKPGSAPAKHGTDGAFARASRGFMGQEWDGGDVAFNPDTWSEVLRVLKPGGHMVAFSGSRTYHRMACAIEDTGFEIRDQLMWLYGSGFPKSQNVSLAIDKAAGAEREKIRTVTDRRGDGTVYGIGHSGNLTSSDPITPEAKQWDGWGTALKPAHEPIVLARKPLIGTVAANVAEYGTGAINIDGCRVGDEKRHNQAAGNKSGGNSLNMSAVGMPQDAQGRNCIGRFPANVMHDGLTEPWAKFFYCAKASKSDRGPNNKHPTVKPNDLMRYLCRLITPPGGVVLDPFTGSGSTGKAALMEGFRFVGTEMSLDYICIAAERIFAVDDSVT